MALNDYECNECGFQVESTEKTMCPKCGNTTRVIFLTSLRQHIKFPEGVFLGLPNTPYITSMRQLREEVKRAGKDRFTECYSKYDDGYRRG